MNPLQQLQEDAVAYLLGNPATALVGYDSFRAQAVQSAVKEAIAGWNVRVAGKVGVYCLVLMPNFSVEDVNVPGVQGSIEITIRTFEDPKVNNTGLSAEDVAFQNLKWFGDGLIIADLLTIVPSTKGPALKPNYDYPGFLVYDTVLTGKLPQDYPGRTPQPKITDDNAGNVTITCDDPDAGIFYTIDGKMPTPGGGGTTQTYLDVFNVPPGTVIRCVGFNPEILPSDVDAATINY